MHIEVSTQDDVTLAAIRGAINSASAPAAQERLLPLATPGCRLVLDLGELSFLASAGLRIFLLLYRQLAAAQGQVALAALPEPIRDTLKLTGFLGMFQVYQDRDAAVAALRPD
jgi:anti-sigma B factor antagonist